MKVVDTKIGKIGALICGENTNPLARYSMIADGEQIVVAGQNKLYRGARVQIDAELEL